MNPFKEKTLITKKQFVNDLKELFNVSPNFKEVCLYKDTYSCNKHLYKVDSPNVFTLGYIDPIGFSIYHEYSKHMKRGERLYNEFRKYLDTYTFIYQKHYFI